MGLVRPTSSTPSRRLGRWVAAAVLAGIGCASPDPLLSFIDDESGLSFTHPPRWSVGFAEQNGLRYRYVTAPKVEGDKEALSITLIAPGEAASIEALAQAYLTGASQVMRREGSSGSTEWTFKDSSSVSSRLRLSPAPFFGGWVRGSDAAFKLYDARLTVLLDSLHAEDARQWPEERFAGMTARIPAAWTRGSRLSNQTSGTMQFKSLPLAVEKGTATIHGFAVLSKEPVPPPGDLTAFNRMVKDRAADTVSLMEHRPWPAITGSETPTGFVDYLRSGNAMTATRIRRWITVKNGVGLTLTCEARADVFDRLDPWCRRLATTVRLD